MTTMAKFNHLIKIQLHDIFDILTKYKTIFNEKLVTL